MRLLFIRHGETSDNAAGRLSSHAPGPALTAKGETQARAVVPSLVKMEIAAIYASTLPRTQQTAEPLAQALNQEVKIVEGIQEINAGELEGRADQEGLMGYVGPMMQWRQDPLARIQGGENGVEFLTRFDTAIAQIEAQHEENHTAAIFGHGAAIRVWTAGRAANIDAKSTPTTELPSAGMIVMTGSFREGWTMESWPSLTEKELSHD